MTQSPIDDSRKKSPQKAFGPRHLAMLAIFAALSMGIYALESMIPNPIPIPGIKLGLANIITLIVLKKYGLRDAALVLLVRILLSSLLFGNLVGMLYSVCGGALCLCCEYVIDRLLAGRALMITGIFGALSHNAGQLMTAMLLTAVPGVLVYVPYLVVSAVLTGLLTSLAAHHSLKLLKKLP